MTDLFDPFEANGLRLRNRIALSPLTRTRADMAGKVGPSSATRTWSSACGSMRR